MPANAEAILALLCVPGAGYAVVNETLDVLAGRELALESLLGLPAGEVVECLGHESGDAAFYITRCTAAERERAALSMDAVRASAVTAVTRADSAYPVALAEALGVSAPPVLFVRGSLQSLGCPAVAIVGAREVSARGLSLTKECARVFAGQGVTVVSGGARGVDTAAIETTKIAHGKGLVVTAEGILDRVRRITSSPESDIESITILSEFMPDARWSSHQAVTRNRTIVALSKLVCAIEPRTSGGTIRTARAALEQGRRLLVQCRPEEAALARQLLRAGAFPLREEETDFANHLIENWEACASPEPRQAMLPET